MRPFGLWLVVAAVAAFAQPSRPVFFQKGVNFTAERPANYNPEAALPVLDQLSGFGINSIALVPYGFVSRETLEVRYRETGGMEDPDGMERIAELAHQRKLKVMWKPQLWAGRGGFAGDVESTTDAARVRFFQTYTRFIEFHARKAARAQAEVFCIGTELAKMSIYDREWRALIAHIREIYHGPITYAAIQGPEFETLRFWDALDWIGLNNYYPVPDSLDFSQIVAKVETVQRKFGKPVIFPEAGYTSLESPNRAPWDETPRKISLTDQARCYDALLTAFYRKPWFQGVYWWKVGTNGRGGPGDGSHTPWQKPAMEVIARWFKLGGR